MKELRSAFLSVQNAENIRYMFTQTQDHTPITTNHQSAFDLFLRSAPPLGLVSAELAAFAVDVDLLLVDSDPAPVDVDPPPNPLIMRLPKLTCSVLEPTDTALPSVLIRRGKVNHISHLTSGRS